MSDDKGETGWLGVLTKVNLERVAITNIERQGFLTYCPMIQRFRRHARKVEMVERPLFPGYVFVDLNTAKGKWRSLLSTKGVRSIVRFGDRLGVVPSELIARLRYFEENDKLHQVAVPTFPLGSDVNIVGGPFDGFVGEVLSLPEKDRVWLLLDLMGRKVRICQDAWSLTR